MKKVQTGFYPTPLYEMKNLSKHCGKSKMFVKRDDLTGIGMGGNKLRKLDYIVKDALDKGYTTLLTYGGVQTNHGRLTAAAAAKYGLKCIIMCFGMPPEEASGNILLDRMMGAEVCFMNTTEVRKLPDDVKSQAYIKLRNDSTNEIISRYEKAGEKVYIVPIGGHCPLGTLGYIEAVKEIMSQLKDLGEKVTDIVTGFGSGGTFAGLWLGAKYYNAPFKVSGIAVAPLAQSVIEAQVNHINEVSKYFDMGIECSLKDLVIKDGFWGEGYNIPDQKTREYVYLIAKLEGIMVDPCYTGKSLRGYITMVESGEIKGNSIYLHTGGAPGIYTKEHLDAMQDEIWHDKATIFEFKGL